jgi:hypothetical protein
MQRYFPTMWGAAMLEQINPLPGPQSELTAHDRNRNLDAGHGRADVGRHVVVAFICVPIPASLLRREAVKKSLEIGANIGCGVLLNKQSGRGVPNKQRQKSCLQRARLEPIGDIARNLDESTAASRKRKNINELAHFKAR